MEFADIRKPLKNGEVLPFDGMACTIEGIMGVGSNTIVYQGSYPDKHFESFRHQVLIKELFPYDPNGSVYRDENKCIACLPEADAMFALQKKSFESGNAVHLRLLQAYPSDIEANLNTFSYHNTLYSVLGFSGGRSLDSELKAMKGFTLKRHVVRMLDVLHVLEEFHQSGYLHLDLSPDNILLIGEGKRERVALIDYNSVHSLQEIHDAKQFYYSAKQGYTAPEVTRGLSEQIGYWTDLYSLTAVFYTCLMGHPLQVMNELRSGAPDVTNAFCLEDMPQTVLDLVQRILLKGLSKLPSRRYANCAEMIDAFEELFDRIDGKGITHWALWENGRLNVLREIRNNQALAYIRDEDAMFPVMASSSEGNVLPIKELMQAVIQKTSANSVFLLGSGGTGKTTALLSAAYDSMREYSPYDPAIAYIPLYDYHGEDSYIKNRLLENLWLKPHTDTMEAARQELIRLLSLPLHGRYGERPKLILLLDGLNEASGDVSLLLQEMQELASLNGVRICVSSRSEFGQLPFDRICLQGLSQQQVGKVLSNMGILKPENQDLSQLLETPLMLAIFIQTALNGDRRLKIESKDALLEKYLSAVKEKEIRKLSADSDERWRIETAIYFVLPSIAKEMSLRKDAMDDTSLLSVVRKCYKRLNNDTIFKVFPEWIGYRDVIIGEEKHPEAWYGRIVHNLLWRRLGLLVKDNRGQYRISHEIIGEYLVRLYDKIDRYYKRRKAVSTCVIIILCALATGLCLKTIPGILEEMVSPLVYDVNAASAALSNAVAVYADCARQYEMMHDLIEKYDNPQLKEETLRYLKQERDTELSISYLEDLLPENGVMPWSRQPIDREAYLALAQLRVDDALKYMQFVKCIDYKEFDERNETDYLAQMHEQLMNLVECDAYVAGKYYRLLLEPELVAMRQSDPTECNNYMRLIAFYGEMWKIVENSNADIIVYEEKQRQAWNQLQANPLPIIANNKAE